MWSRVTKKMTSEHTLRWEATGEKAKAASRLKQPPQLPYRACSGDGENCLPHRRRHQHHREEGRREHRV